MKGLFLLLSISFFTISSLAQDPIITFDQDQYRAGDTIKISMSGKIDPGLAGINGKTICYFKSESTTKHTCTGTIPRYFNTNMPKGFVAAYTANGKYTRYETDALKIKNQIPDSEKPKLKVEDLGNSKYKVSISDNESGLAPVLAIVAGKQVFTKHLDKCGREQKKYRHRECVIDLNKIYDGKKVDNVPLLFNIADNTSNETEVNAGSVSLKGIDPGIKLNDISARCSVDRKLRLAFTSNVMIGDTDFLPSFNNSELKCNEVKPNKFKCVQDFFPEDNYNFDPNLFLLHKKFEVTKGSWTVGSITENFSFNKKNKKRLHRCLERFSFKGGKLESVEITKEKKQRLQRKGETRSIQ